VHAGPPRHHCPSTQGLLLVPGWPEAFVCSEQVFALSQACCQCCEQSRGAWRREGLLALSVLQQVGSRPLTLLQATKAVACIPLPSMPMPATRLCWLLGVAGGTAKASPSHIYTRRKMILTLYPYLSSKTSAAVVGCSLAHAPVH